MTLDEYNRLADVFQQIGDRYRLEPAQKVKVEDALLDAAVMIVRILMSLPKEPDKPRTTRSKGCPKCGAGAYSAKEGCHNCGHVKS